ncbi:unnamed protein product [Symbiodinium natans]|uniref:Uncharacterized protein n=1 Tax=Symbiodinium natans TaxID=878477 RepID=A0A812RNT9_9DINO|nr:unnamed protein product [Symbiodinium natans]
MVSSFQTSRRSCGPRHLKWSSCTPRSDLAPASSSAPGRRYAMPRPEQLLGRSPVWKQPR